MLFKGQDGGSAITALTLDMSAAGAATFNNDVTAFSDERLKSNITTIPDALSKVSEMRGVHYVRDETGKDSSGVIAQELQKIAPELVLTAEDEMGTLSVNYGNITGYLIEAIKELKAEIEELKAR
jgi:ABC-type Fe2+-enterobactin transport system substrate-binding protein